MAGTGSTESEALAYGYMFSISWLLAAIIISIANIIHTKNVISDLCTTRRKSVAHRPILPRIDTNYKLLSLLALIFTNVLMISSILLVYSSFILNHTGCTITLYFRNYSTQIAKTCMYLIFVLRLRMAFNDTIYAYSKTCLAFTTAAIIGLSLVSIIAVSTGLDFSLEYLSDGKGFPNLCKTIAGPPVFVVGASVMIQDLFIGIGLAIAFIVRLRKGMGMVQANQLAHVQSVKVLDLNIKLTLKITILTAVAVISTVFTVLLAMIGVPFAKCLFSVDAWMNVFCILLMTPYYPADYFQRLCCLCICCYTQCNHMPKASAPGLTLFVTSSSGCPVSGSSPGCGSGSGTPAEQQQSTNKGVSTTSTSISGGTGTQSTQEA